jgi:DNA repair protein RadC
MTFSVAYIREAKITYVRKRVKDDLLKKPVQSSRQVFDLFRNMQNEAKEKVICLHLNPQLEILSYELVAIGGAHRVFINPVEIYRVAIISLAHSIVLVHNHPSGHCKPSKEDRKTAKAIREMGRIHSIPLQDFLIIGDGDYYSFHDEGEFEKTKKAPSKKRLWDK